MKGAAELLGVSYGTLYGRYRETFGYLKHSWSPNIQISHPVPSLAPSAKATYSRGSGSGGSINYQPKTELEHEAIFEQLRAGRITIKQAGNLLGIDPTTLAHQLSGKVARDYFEIL